jgi:hypothetical protein
MDTRRFITETKASLVGFLNTHLNDAALADLWANVGGSVLVGVARPAWKLPDALDKPVVILRKVRSTTELSDVSQNQAIVEGYWKDMVFEIHCCTDDGVGGRLTVDDLSSAVEYVLSNYSSELQTDGVLLWQFDDSTETDDAAQYENVSTLTVRVLVPGENIEPEHLELGRFQFTAEDYGHFYPGTVLQEAQLLEATLINATSASEAVCTVICRNTAGVLKTRTLTIPRATASGTILSFTGGDPTEEYVEVTSVTADGGQAGYLFAIYNKIGG